MCGVWGGVLGHRGLDVRNQVGEDFFSFCANQSAINYEHIIFRRRDIIMVVGYILV